MHSPPEKINFFVSRLFAILSVAGKIMPWEVAQTVERVRNFVEASQINSAQ